jgi:prepilin-type N-terminal cleavage/methylation domain-containing protein
MNMNICLPLKKRSRHLGSESGMSLVETLVAIAILALCSTVFIGALSTGSIATSTHDEGATSQGLAQTQIEAIKAAAYDSTGASYSTIPVPTGYAISINTNSTIYSNNHIQKITVAVFHNGSNVFQLEDYKAIR